MKARHVLRDRIIKAYFSRVAKLHQHCCREEFCNRGAAIDRLRRGHAVLLQIGKAEAFSPDDLLIVDHGSRHSGNALIMKDVAEARFDYPERCGHFRIFMDWARSRLCLCCYLAT